MLYYYAKYGNDTILPTQYHCENSSSLKGIDLGFIFFSATILSTPRSENIGNTSCIRAGCSIITRPRGTQRKL